MPIGGEDTQVIGNEGIRELESLEVRAIHRPAPSEERTAAITSVASAFPETAYSQEEIGALLGLDNRVVKKLLGAPHIRKRHLYLPARDTSTGRMVPESAADLHAKFRNGALDIGSRAIRNALDAASLSPADVDYMLCVTSSGFMVPGLSSLFSRELGFDHKLLRADVVGMGCNAGLNGLNPLVQWVRNHPGRVALLVCCEINSAMYVLDETPRTGIVNSLFGDGAAAAVLSELPARLRRSAESVTAPGPDQVTLQLAGGITIVWGGTGQASAKSEELSVLMRTHSHYYDVSAQGTVVIK